MKSSQALAKLESMLGPDVEEISRNLILKDDNGYLAFSKYCLTHKKNSEVVVSKFGHSPRKFSSMRIALSWCISDKFNRHALCMDLERLDLEKIHLSNDLKIRQQIIQKIRDPERQEIAEVKISTKKLRLKHIENRLDKCVNLAKYWQLRGFNDEIARTRRPAPNRSNRKGF